MNSPANILANVFENVAQSDQGQELFLRVVANSFGLTGIDGELSTLRRLTELTNESHQLVSDLPHPDFSKELARAYLSPLEGFRAYSYFGHTLDQLRNPVLLPGTIQGLRLLHMILRQQIIVSPVTPDVQTEIDQLRALISTFHDLDLPIEIKKPTIVRLMQVLEAVDHYEFLGETNLSIKIDALVGQITVAVTSANKNATKLISGIVAVVVSLGTALIGADKVTAAYLGLTNSVPKILGLPSPVEQGDDIL